MRTICYVSEEDWGWSGYFFLLDYYENLDVGKRLTNIELISNGQKLTVGKKLKHSVLKCICCAV